MTLAQRLRFLGKQWADALDGADRIEALETALRAIYEVWAGSDGFTPKTCAEGYQQRLIYEMRDIARAALKEGE